MELLRKSCLVDDALLYVNAERSTEAFRKGRIILGLRVDYLKARATEFLGINMRQVEQRLAEGEESVWEM